jgi:glycosyltransferase involved in cell wall biosynthesis
MRVLVVYDVEGWAYYHHACALRQNAPPDIGVHICAVDAVSWEQAADYDLLFWMPYRNVALARAEVQRRGLRLPLVVSYTYGPYQDEERWLRTLDSADFAIVNSVYRWQLGGALPRTCAIANGVDEAIFRTEAPITERPHRCLWVGSILAAEVKSYQSVILPLQEELQPRGFECDFRLVDSFAAPLRLDEMACWYNSGSYILCASVEEGTPNPILEGMSCGCVAVSTLVGNLREFGRDGENCLIAERSVASFVEKLEFAREKRRRLSENGLATMKKCGFAWRERSQYYYQLWRRVIRDGAHTVRPFRYDETNWQDI